MLGDHDNINIDLLRQRGEDIRRAISILARHASLPQNDFVDDERVLETLQSDRQEPDLYLSATGEAIREQI